MKQKKKEEKELLSLSTHYKLIAISTRFYKTIEQEKFHNHQTYTKMLIKTYKKNIPSTHRLILLNNMKRKEIF